MATLTLRLVKGFALTNSEMDNNLTDLNNDIATRLLSSTYTASDILAKLVTVDGTGSTLDADFVRGLSSASSNIASTVVTRDISGNFSANTITASLIGNVSGTASNVSGVVSIANGGTGTTTPSIVAGSNITITGSFPNQTINGSAGGVTTFSGNSTGLTPNTATSGAITLGGILALANGGTGTATPSIVAGTGITISGSFPNQTINASASGSAITVVNDISTATAIYPTLSSVTSGTATTLNTSSSKLSYIPLSGQLSATSFNSASDENLKENIHTSVGLNSITKLRGVEFTWKDSKDKSSGIIAQELEKILPHLVYTSDEDSKSVNYSGLVAYLIESIKELNIRVLDLESK